MAIVRAAYETLTSEGLQAFSAYWADDIEWEAIGGRWRGPDAGIAYMQAWFDSFDDFSTEPIELIDAGGDWVVIYLRYSGRARQSGIEVPPSYFAIAIEVRDAQFVRAVEYPTREEALEAVDGRE